MNTNNKKKYFLVENPSMTRKYQNHISPVCMSWIDARISNFDGRTKDNHASNGSQKLFYSTVKIPLDYGLGPLSTMIKMSGITSAPTHKFDMIIRTSELLNHARVPFQHSWFMNRFLSATQGCSLMINYDNKTINIPQNKLPFVLHWLPLTFFLSLSSPQFSSNLHYSWFIFVWYTFTIFYKVGWTFKILLII